MFRIKEVRKNNRVRLLVSPSAAHIAATAAVLMMVLGSSTALARRPPTPANFRVTTTTAYTVTLAWDPAPPNSGEFNYYLWGAYNVGPTVIRLPSPLTYGDLKLMPFWDPLRGEPCFEKIVASLAPK